MRRAQSHTIEDECLIETLPISLRLFNALRAMKVEAVYQVKGVQFSLRRLERRLGKKGLKELLCVLYEMDYR